MRDRRRASRGLSAALAALAALQLVACQSDYMSWMDDVLPMGGAESGEEPDEAVDLPLGSWTRDVLHCAAGRCERWYEIEVPETGMLRVDLYAPVGRGLPDCDMSLETRGGTEVPARVGRVQTQRRLRYEAAAGTYRLKIASSGASRDVFEFEVVAEVRESEPESRTAPSPPPPPPERHIPVADVPRTESPRPPAPPVPETVPEASAQEAPPVDEVDVSRLPAEGHVADWVVAEVLDVEESGGVARAVMIEAGAPAGIQTGMVGELYEGAAVIGRIEVVDVYPTGSRARVIGELTAPISFDTLSRIDRAREARDASETSGE